MKTVLKIIVVLVCVPALFFGLLLAFFYWQNESHPVSVRKMAKMREGMTTAEVTNLLGQPWKSLPHDDGDFYWVYGGGLHLNYFLIEFSAASNVLSFHEDS